MKLTDKEYLVLASLADTDQGVVQTGSTIRGMLQDCSGAGEPHSLTQEIPADSLLLELKLAARWIAPDAAGYAFTNENDDRWIIFAYKPDALQEHLKTLLSGENPLMKQAAQFLRANHGSRDCFVTGFGLGGALALYAAGFAEDIQGVVFDAPGIGQLPEAQGSGQSRITNILAYNSLISTLGSHSEKLQFAGPAGGDTAVELLSQADRHRYVTGAGGSIVTGEPGEAFGLLSKLSILFEEGGRIDEVAAVFLRAAGLEDSGASELIHAVLPLSERIEPSGIRDALAEITAQYDRHAGTVWRKWKTEMTGQARKLGQEELSAVFAEKSEAAMLSASALLEELYRITEAFLCVLILYGPEESRLADQLDELLDSLTGPMTDRLEQLSRQMASELDGLMELSLSTAFVWPEMHFDIKD
ncbi:hypothetical protein C2I18_18960 [Paenibacillus sp. PK3_47]|uniref:DUF2974 domain-containing protein n=1 Tax=Paenibacillus sp. PK3_47 TaxID=2072642 RepID=UPI00201DE617|nr:DUF2974 domain-containing protein [Paenibacillus sp. PK3_47]UQZ35418.1 hypothetical protein C2I18_18960 [Paenibacillus sp. PK3_47]